MAVTTAIERPTRSMLFMPGHKARPHEKAKELAMDWVIFDWEDAVGNADKADARTQTNLSLRKLKPWHCGVLVRINHPASIEFEADIAEDRFFFLDNYFTAYNYNII